ncbi:ARMT1-like domain-containing protein [Chlorobium sp. N1]|uniref:damage-control phosphatase ARMT1 family protein n=1 Tax=Chlorobium sp. N1 TaxID=2491138 RepID=UPI00103D7DE4|nr:ARMT1-like domain-containing protein [Chlorobium sp. N1]TCD47099.1 DUF89 family protein [Chlorobium sp. N1]
MTTPRRTIPAECYSCLFGQLDSLVNITGMDEKQAKSLFEHAMRKLLETQGEGIVAQHLIRSATDHAALLLGNTEDFDPYRQIKKESNDIAMAFAERFSNSSNDGRISLEEAVKVAAAGNIIDFGALRHGSLDIEKELASIDGQAFGCFDMEPFKSRLGDARRLLYICDNAGEIVFDRLFVETIARLHPGLEITCSVRERPVINDAVMADALYVGLDTAAPVVSSGSVYPGTLLEETSEAFRRLYDEADLVIAKGQGNFETLLEEADPKLFFILRIKCGRMARLSGILKGELVLMQGGGQKTR